MKREAACDEPSSQEGLRKQVLHGGKEGGEGMGRAEGLELMSKIDDLERKIGVLTGERGALEKERDEKNAIVATLGDDALLRTERDSALVSRWHVRSCCAICMGTLLRLRLCV